MSNTDDMRVTKRNGELEDIAFDKILNRIKKLGLEVGIHINYSSLAMKVIDQLYDTISTTKIDELASEQCASMSTSHPDYGVLASRIIVSNHQKNTLASFTETMRLLHNFVDIHGDNYPLISEDLWELVCQKGEQLEAMIDYERDYLIDYFGFKTLERAYLFRVGDKVVERPQHMWLRVAIGIHGTDLDAIKETYDLMSLKYFTHATPTLFNAGTPRPQLSSCYLVAMQSDSLDGIYDTLKDCAIISKYAGGIGIHIHNIRAKGTHIRGTNGTSNGIIPMLKVFNNTARYVDQCVTGDTYIMVQSEDGSHETKMQIKDIVPNKTQIYTFHYPEDPNYSKEHFNTMNELKQDIQFDIGTQRIEMCKQLNTAKNVVTHKYSGNILEITVTSTWSSDLTLRITENHPILACKNGKISWVEAKDLVTGDNIINGSYLSYETITNIRKIHYDGLLYDLEMNGEFPNYCTDTTILHNGGGKRNGSIAVFLETWHADIQDFLELKKNHGDEEMKARDLFYALWTSDLFMERVKENQDWSLFCPHECPRLSDVYGDEFKTLYEKYEADGKARKVVKARDLWFAILDAQMETGTPYICYKDAVNRKTNQKNIGTIKSSNLCVEVNLYSDATETAVCNLASIALPSFVNETTHIFDFEKLHHVTKVITNNLNKVIDINFYPTEKTKKSNMRHRPIGIGVQGLADTFILMDIPFHSEEAKALNKQIFETIYHASLEKSNELAKERYDYFASVSYLSAKIHGLSGEQYTHKMNPYEILAHKPHFAQSSEAYTAKTYMGAYSSFVGSPASHGILQFDMWEQTPSNDRYNWDELKANIVKYGLRNSVLVSPMPTASTSQILGFNECFEPFTSNIYSRKTLAGEFVIVNKYLMKELINLGLWSEKIKNNIIANKGSVQQLTMLPEHVRNKYKIVWEIPMKHLIDMSADRGIYIDQSQSLNLWQEDPTYNTLTSMHFYAWKKGLKTGIYYLRRKAKHQAQQFTIEPEKKGTVSAHSGEEICEMCSA